MEKRLFIFFLFIAAFCKAQYLDTLHEVFKHKSSIDARIESRYSIINNQYASVTGVRLGVAFQRKLRLGGGVSWLKTNYGKPIFDNGTDQPFTGFRYLKFAYMCFYVDFVFHKTKRWQLSVPIQTGLGMGWYQNDKTVYDVFGKQAKYGLFLYEPGITAQFKVFKWFGLGSDVGYRFAVKDNKTMGERLSSPTYSLKLLIFFDQLFYEALPENKITKKYGPAVW